MSAIVSEVSRIYAAKAFLASLGIATAQANNNMYIFIGHTLPWSDADAPGATDNFPPYPIDTIAGHINVWANMIHLKRINSSDCNLVIQRFDWTENTVYQQYDQDLDLLDPTAGRQPFFVLTDDMNVYKCLFNFNGGASYIKPTGTSTNTIQTGDGYFWKYMFTVSTSDQQKFLTNEWIPVRTLVISDNSRQWDVQQNAIAGSIDVIQVEDNGFGYVIAPTVTITGDGTNAQAISLIKNGKVVGIKMLNRGKNYTFASATVTGGQVTAATITDHGSGYLSTPVVDISGDGTGATGHAVLVNGSVTQIVIDTPGSNYTTATITVASGAGVQALALATVSGGVILKTIMPPPGGHGSDPVTELGAIYAMLTAQLQFDESGKFTITNDFRTLGILNNPNIWNTKQLGTGTLYSQAWNLPLSSVNTNFVSDELIKGLVSGATGVVLDYNSSTEILRAIDVVGSFVPGETVETVDTLKHGLLQFSTGIAQGGGSFQITLASGDTHTAVEYDLATLKITSGLGVGQVRIISTYNATTKVATVTKNWDTTPDASSHYTIAQIKYPDLQPNTGEILYVENRRPIARASAQIESMRPVIEF